jgi:hypothetical protein
LGAKYKNNDPASEEEIWIPIQTQWEHPRWTARWVVSCIEPELPCTHWTERVLGVLWHFRWVEGMESRCTNSASDDRVLWGAINLAWKIPIFEE